MTETQRHEAHRDSGVSASNQRRRVMPAGKSQSSPRRGMRTMIALDLGRLAGAMSRRLGMGSGGIIGGRLALAVQPKALGALAAGRQVVMITGTNGKTTTTQMVAEALRSRGPAVSNATGANMLDGHVAALMSQLDAPFAALEVDELHLAQVTREFEPSVIVLLNLSRDQLDRVGEIRTVERSIRMALQQAPDTHVVANRDDPNIVSAAIDHGSVTWISGGARWKHDALNCPRCGAYIADTDAAWHCRCGLSRPEADWTVTSGALTGPGGERHELSLNLPGQVNRINTAFALAAAVRLGCDPDAALARIGRITQTAGRYGNVMLGNRPVRLLLAKNPASWLEMLELVSGHHRPLILVVNSREADGYDVSWLWDIDFECLAGRTVTVAGDRALDLAVRLRYADVRCEVAETVEAAVRLHDENPDIVANYTAFRDVFARSVRR